MKITMILLMFACFVFAVMARDFWGMIVFIGLCLFNIFISISLKDINIGILVKGRERKGKK